MATLRDLKETPDKLADAMDRHRDYRDALFAYDGFFLDREDKVLLAALLMNTIRRIKDGDLKDVDGYPDWDDLQEELSGEFGGRPGWMELEGIDQDLIYLSGKIEENAIKLIEILEDERYLEQLDGLSKRAEDFLEHQNKVLERLSESHNGLVYIKETFLVPLQSIDIGLRTMDGKRPPAAHLDRLTGIDINYIEEGIELFDKAASLHASVFLELLPTLLAKDIVEVDFSYVIGYSVDFFARFYRETDLLTGLSFSHYDEIVDIYQFEELVIRIAEYHEYNPGYLAEIGSSIGQMLPFIACVLQTYMKFRRLLSDGGLRNTVDFMKELTQLAVTGDEVLDKLLKRYTRKIPGALARKITIYTQVVDMVINLWDMDSALHKKEYMVAAGHGLQAVGAGTIIAGAIIFKSSAAATPVPLVAAIVAVVGILLMLAGVVLTVFGPSDLLSLLYRHCYFGTNWHQVGLQEAPDKIYFKFKERVEQGNSETRANFVRQISALLSLLIPLRLQEVQIEDNLAAIRIEPTLANIEGNIVIKALDDTGVVIWAYPLPLEMPSIADQPPWLDIIDHSPMMDPGDRLKWWECKIDASLWDLVEYIEVELPLPAYLSDEVIAGITQGTRSLDNDPIVLRETRKI